MIRAFLLRLLGYSPVWEVRSVSMKSGKDIPGERKFKGGYRGARAYFKEHPAPPDHELRLQALLVTKSRYFPTIDDSPLTAEDIEDIHQRHDSPPVLVDVPHGTPEPTPGIDDLEEPEQDHECDAEGPLDWDETGGAYVPTCSVCGRLN